MSVGAGALEQRPAGCGRRRRRSWSSTRAGQSGAQRPQLGGVDGRVDVDLGDARRQVGRAPARSPGGCRRRRTRTKWSGKTTPSSAASRRNGKPMARSVDAAGQAQRAGRSRRPARGRCRRTRAGAASAPRWVSRWLTSKPQRMARSTWARQLAADLVEVGVVPQVGDGAGEAAVAVEQRRGVGDRAPPVEVVLGVEREVDADVLAPVAGGRLAGPRARAPSAMALVATPSRRAS